MPIVFALSHCEAEIFTNTIEEPYRYLTENGKARTKELKTIIENTPIGLIFSTAHARCIETAQIITDNAPVRLFPEELSHPLEELQQVLDLLDTPLHTTEQENPIRKYIETELNAHQEILEIQGRKIVHFIQDAMKERHTGTMLLIGFPLFLVAILMGLGMDKMEQFNLENGNGLVFHINKAYNTITDVNPCSL
jgi:broad specificity phosphatase PhoE